MKQSIKKIVVASSLVLAAFQVQATSRGLSDDLNKSFGNSFDASAGSVDAVSEGSAAMWNNVLAPSGDVSVAISEDVSGALVVSFETSQDGSQWTYDNALKPSGKVIMGSFAVSAASGRKLLKFVKNSAEWTSNAVQDSAAWTSEQGNKAWGSVAASAVAVWTSKASQDSRDLGVQSGQSVSNSGQASYDHVLKPIGGSLVLVFTNISEGLGTISIETGASLDQSGHGKSGEASKTLWSMPSKALKATFTSATISK